jgi:ribosome-associated protein
MNGQQRITIADILDELRFVASRSRGPGGQHVNKVNSRITLRWDVVHSNKLTAEQRQVIRQKLARYITANGELLLHASDSRSQLGNKEIVIEKLDAILKNAFTVTKKRKATRPTSASRVRRLEGKKHKAEKKQWRKKLR